MLFYRLFNLQQCPISNSVCYHGLPTELLLDDFEEFLWAKCVLLCIGCNYNIWINPESKLCTYICSAYTPVFIAAVYARSSIVIMRVYPLKTYLIYSPSPLTPISFIAPSTLHSLSPILSHFSASQRHSSDTKWCNRVVCTLWWHSVNHIE